MTPPIVVANNVRLTLADFQNTNMRHQDCGTQAFSPRVALIDGAENLMAYYEALFTSEIDASQDFSMLTGTVLPGKTKIWQIWLKNDKAGDIAVKF